MIKETKTQYTLTYNCPKTSAEERVTVEQLKGIKSNHTNSSVKNVVIDLGRKAVDCSGIKTCGVEVDLGFNETYPNWEKCSFNAQNTLDLGLNCKL